MNREEQLAAADISDNEALFIYNQIHEWLAKAGIINVKARGIWNQPRTKTQKRKVQEPANIITELHVHTQKRKRLESMFRIEDEKNLSTAKIVAEENKLAEKVGRLKLLAGESIQYLLTHGKIINIDFTIDNAIESAKSLRHTQLVDAREAANEPEYLKHECSECEEWYPTAHRCSCGNRRIAYESEGESFKDLYIYPIAY